MNQNRFQKWMSAVDLELLEEAKEPPQRTRKKFRAIGAIAVCFVLLVGGVMIGRMQDSGLEPHHSSVQLANPIQTVTAAEVTRLGYRIPLPAEAQESTYQLITMDQETVRMAQVSFRLNEKNYTCRALKTEQATDISGLHETWSESIDWVIGTLQMQMRKSADSAWVGWFSAEDSVQWCLSGNPDTVLHTAREIVETLGYQMAVAPAGAEQIAYDVLSLNGLSVGETKFTLDGIGYTYRTAATTEVREDFADISGLEGDYPVTMDTAVSYCEARMSYEDGGIGKIVWFDTVPGLLFSVSMDSGASSIALEDMALQLFTPAQGDVG